MSRPAWRNDFTEVNVDDRSTKLPKTYREPPKLNVDFRYSQANSKRLLGVYNLKPVKRVASKSGVRTVQVDYSIRANEKLMSRLGQPSQANDQTALLEQTLKVKVITLNPMTLNFVTRYPHNPTSTVADLTWTRSRGFNFDRSYCEGSLNRSTAG